MFKPKPEDIDSLDKAKGVITLLAKESERNYIKMLRAQAQFYNLRYNNEPEPKELELKSRIVYLEQELEKIIRQRDKLKLKLSGKEI